MLRVPCSVFRVPCSIRGEAGRSGHGPGLADPGDSGRRFRHPADLRAVLAAQGRLARDRGDRRLVHSRLPGARRPPRPGRRHDVRCRREGMGVALLRPCGRRRDVRDRNRLLRRPDHDRHAGGRNAGGADGAGVLHRLHEGRLTLRLVLHRHEPVRGVDASARAVEQPAFPLRRVGGRGILLVPPDRLLVGETLSGGSGEEGVHHDTNR